MDEPPRALRCAIYTRKSTEEGLDRHFNSLEAQRESGEAYIASQAAAGWMALPERYDDGGFTGANLDRPALKRLLDDIEHSRLDCVVVYKVDRLSRSLLDFARLMDRFERRQVSFVSVTQPFNTTTSLGRLTLNVLLSFAQFERELIGERTRDKMSAARRKGKWTGGIPVLGYDVDPKGGRLIVNQAEAERVREIFRITAEMGSLEAACREARARGLTTKDWTSRNGRRHAPQPFSKTTLRGLLGNVIYIGSIRHKGAVCAGEQPAIVEEKLWREVNEKPMGNGRHQKGLKHNRQDALLAGLLECGQCGAPMKPTFTRQRAYRYYACDCAQRAVASEDLESELARRMEPLLGHAPSEDDLRQALQRVTYDSRTRQGVVDLREGTRFEFPLEPPLRRGVRNAHRKTQGRIPRISRLMALALKWEGLVREGRLRDYAEIACLGQVSRARLSQIMGLLNLAPSIQEALLLLPRIVRGRDRVTEKRMRAIAQPIDLQRQQEMFQDLMR